MPDRNLFSSLSTTHYLCAIKKLELGCSWNVQSSTSPDFLDVLKNLSRSRGRMAKALSLCNPTHLRHFSSLRLTFKVELRFLIRQKAFQMNAKYGGPNKQLVNHKTPALLSSSGGIFWRARKTVVRKKLWYNSRTQNFQWPAKTNYARASLPELQQESVSDNAICFMTQTKTKNLSLSLFIQGHTGDSKRIQQTNISGTVTRNAPAPPNPQAFTAYRVTPHLRTELQKPATLTLDASPVLLNEICLLTFLFFWMR